MSEEGEFFCPRALESDCNGYTCLCCYHSRFVLRLACACVYSYSRAIAKKNLVPVEGIQISDVPGHGALCRQKRKKNTWTTRDLM